MLVTKEIEIDMGHRVTNHKSKCASLHGHRYKIEVGVDDKVIDTEGSSDEGMVIDFGDLKDIMMQAIDAKYDHGFVLWKEDPMYESLCADSNTKLVGVNFIPTAENLARHWYLRIKPDLEKRNIKIKHVKVWETPTSTATYEE
jgi:6-pyruvoyltetrahydropterin/6-carboxytetrahydropterin synthase